MEAKEAMEKLSFFHGSWTLESTYLNQDGEWVSNPEGEAQFTKILKGLSLLDESSFYFFGQLYVTNSLVSFDFLRQEYRQIIVDDFIGYPDVHSGKFEGDNLVMTNLNTGTAFISNGKEIFYKSVYEEVKDDSFTMTIFSSGDRKNWTKIQVINYRRKV